MHDVPLGNTPLWVTLVSDIFLEFAELPIKLHSYKLHSYIVVI